MHFSISKIIWGKVKGMILLHPQCTFFSAFPLFLAFSMWHPGNQIQVFYQCPDQRRLDINLEYTWRKLKRTWGEHADSTRKALRPSCHRDFVFVLNISTIGLVSSFRLYSKSCIVHVRTVCTVYHLTYVFYKINSSVIVKVVKSSLKITTLWKSYKCRPPNCFDFPTQSVTLMFPPIASYEKNLGIVYLHIASWSKISDFSWTAQGLFIPQSIFFYFKKNSSGISGSIS